MPIGNDETFAFPFQCILLKFNGVWPLQRTSSNQFNFINYLYLVWSYFMIILIALTCAAQTGFLITALSNILEFTECGCTVFMGIHNLLRLIHLSVKRKALKRLIETFVQDIWFSRWVFLLVYFFVYLIFAINSPFLHFYCLHTAHRVILAHWICFLSFSFLWKHLQVLETLIIFPFILFVIFLPVLYGIKNSFFVY